MDDQQNNAKVSEDANLQSPLVVETPHKDQVASKTKSLKKPLVGALALVVLLAGALGFVFLAPDAEESQIANNESVEQSTPAVTTLGATIASIEGPVEYSKEGEFWKAAEGGQSLANLEYVRTLNGGRAIILFDDGSIARLDANSQVYLSSLQTDEIEITLVSGQVYSRVVESDSREYVVVTSNDRFVALGTAYKTTTDGVKDELEVYHSQVKVTSADLAVAEGNKYDSVTKESKALDLDGLEVDDFAQWNKQKDSENSDFVEKLGVLKDKPKVETPAPTPSPAPQPANPSQPSGIVLSGSAGEKGVNLSWSLNGVSSSQGFKVVRAKNDSTPSYGQDEATYVGKSEARSTVWYSDNGASHYYRVCIYKDGTCSNYSNSVRVTSPLVQKEPVATGGVGLTIDDKLISWSLSGGTAPHGFKVTLSSSTNPTYPQNSIKYVGSDTRSVTLPEKAPGTYYVRICKYTNGTQDAGCVDYSNEVEYIVAE